MMESEADARRIVEALGGRWSGGGGVCFCPAHDNHRSPALSVGVGRSGRLLLRCHSGCTFPEIMTALGGRGLIDAAGAQPASAEDLECQRREMEREEAKTRERILSIWRETVPLRGTTAEKYLREVRGLAGIDFSDDLRFHPHLLHNPSGERLPALVSAVVGGSGPAVHRTYLAPDGAKAAVSPAKMMVGGCAGGHVHVAGAGGDLIAGEGIETAASLAILIGRPATVWAGLSASGLANLALPSDPGKILIGSDGDATGRAAGLRLAERAVAAGWTVEAADAGDGLDFNDNLFAARAAHKVA